MAAPDGEGWEGSDGLAAYPSLSVRCVRAVGYLAREKKPMGRWWQMEQAYA